MRKSFLYLFICTISLLGCSIQNDVSRIDAKKKVILKTKNHIIAKEFVYYCYRYGLPPPIHLFKEKNIDEYWKKMPELKLLREEYLELKNTYNEILTNDEAYRLAYVKWLSTPSDRSRYAQLYLNKSYETTTNRLLRSNQEFKKISIELKQAKLDYNILTLEQIIEEYKKNDEIFPVEWIPKAQLKKFHQHSAVIRLDKRYKRLQKKYMKTFYK